MARGVEATELAEYQRAVREVLTRDLITAERPRAGVLERVLRWSDQMAEDFRELFGYQLIATTHLVRLVRRLDAFDATQGQLFSRNRRPFDRRRLAYLCLVLASFQRSRVEISLADLVRLVTPAANAIEGLGFEPTVTAHKAALVDAIDWLVDHGALRLSDGSLEAWARDDRTGDALYDIDHEICTALFKPARPVQHLTSAAGLLHAGMPDVMREARRLLVEHPVVYFSEVRPELAEVLPRAAEELARLTGLTVEHRAEGVMLADPSGRFTDRPFPGQGGAVNRAAGLLLASVADLVEEGVLTKATPSAPSASPSDSPAEQDGRAVSAAQEADPSATTALHRPEVTPAVSADLYGSQAERGASAVPNGPEVSSAVSADLHGSQAERSASAVPSRLGATPVVPAVLHGSQAERGASAVPNGLEVSSAAVPADLYGAQAEGDAFAVPVALAGGRAGSAAPGGAGGSAGFSEVRLLARIDSALPEHGVVAGLAWTPPEAGTPVRDVREGGGEELWFVPQERLDAAIGELYAEFGAASFTSAWQADPSGLLAAAVAFLADLRLLRPVPGGVLVLPAAFRYRNITLALPERGQLSLEENPA